MKRLKEEGKETKRMKRYKDIQEVEVQEVVCWWRTLSLVFSNVKLRFFLSSKHLLLCFLYNGLMCMRNAQTRGL